MASKLRLMTTLAVEVAFKRFLLPDWIASHSEIDVEWAPTNVLIDRIRSGERADVAILIDKPLAELAAQGVVLSETVTPIAQARFGLGVKAGAPKPDISTRQAFVSAIANARSIAYSLTGASGVYFTDLVKRLGLADPVLDRATPIASGFTAEKLLDGQADLAVQQISELMSVEGVDIVGPFPEPLQSPTDFSAAIFSQASDRVLADTFLAHLTSERAHRAYEAGGLTSRLAVKTS